MGRGLDDVGPGRQTEGVDVSEVAMGLVRGCERWKDWLYNFCFVCVCLARFSPFPTDPSLLFP
jgi:hypothetical protein